jgi:hypothetical protein
VLAEGPDRLSGLSVSNSLSGGDSALNEVPAVRDPTHVARIGRRHRVSTDKVNARDVKRVTSRPFHP